MPTWPATLPDKVLQEGYDEQLQPIVIRSPMDTGPAKLRRRATAAPRSISGGQRLTAAQVETLDGFYRTDCADGALAFDWKHPRTQAAASLRFVSPPRYASLGGGVYAVSLSFEILP